MNKINKKWGFLILFLIVLFIISSLVIQTIKKMPDYIMSSNGRIEMTQYEVSTLYPGRVTEINIKEGDYVKKGQVVATVSASEIDSQLKIVEAAKGRAESAKKRGLAETEAYVQKYNVAKLDLNNAQKLKKDNLISQTELQKRQAQVKGENSALEAVKSATKEADAAIAEANAHIDKIKMVNEEMQLKSPIDGKVEYQLMEIGSIIPQGGKVISLFDYSDVTLNLFLPNKTIGKLMIGDEARIKIDAIDAVFPAQVTFISSQSQFTPKHVETKSEREKLMFKVKVKIPPEIALKYVGLLKAGLTADGFVKTEKKEKWPSELKIKLPEVIKQ